MDSGSFDPQPDKVTDSPPNSRPNDCHAHTCADNRISHGCTDDGDTYGWSNGNSHKRPHGNTLGSANEGADGNAHAWSHVCTHS